MEDPRCKIIALGGSRGGAGRSTLALGLAIGLARTGRTVLLVDCDTVAPVQHLWLETENIAPPKGAGIGDPEAALEPHTQTTSIEGLSLLTFGHARGFPWVRPRLDAGSLAERLSATHADHVVIDLPGGADPVFAELFFLADHPILVGRRDPVSIWCATQSLRAALFHGIGWTTGGYDAADEFRQLLRDQGLRMNRSTLAPSYLTPDAANVVRDTQRRFAPSLVLTHGESDGDAGFHAALCLYWHHVLGIHPRPMAVFGPRPSTGDPLDDAVTWAGPVIERTRKLTDFMRRHPRPSPESNLPSAVAGLPPDAPKEQVRRQLASIAEALRTRRVDLDAVFDAACTDAVLAIAQRALNEIDAPTQAPSRPPSIPPDSIPATNEPDPTPEGIPSPSALLLNHASDTAEPHMAQKPPLPDHPPTAADNPGAELRSLRKDLNLSLRELSLRTKIGVKYLEALEKMDRTQLPRPVYLRGYLREIAGVYGISEGTLIERYLLFLGHP